MSKKLGLLLILLFSIVTLASGTLSCANQEKVNMPIVLLTDFGSEDYRVSQVKGIIYNNNPEARMIDASHSVPAFDIPTGAFILDIAAKEFPENVVFISIIAPYAQTETKYLVLTTNKNQIFVLPDNGLLTYIVKNMGIKTIYQVTNQQLFDEPIIELAAERIEGKTGALIASGYRPQDIGIPLNNPKTLDIQEPMITAHKLLGTVVYIDHFGNCITNISDDTVNKFEIEPGTTIEVNSSQSKIAAKYGTIYSDVPVGGEIVFVNNNLGVVQLSINLGNFAQAYSIKAGTKIELVK
ncbi:S-adenosyl-l-methionine hydroxide adenosyltransferase family protein [Chloroflexota bacterium]